MQLLDYLKLHTIDFTETDGLTVGGWLDLSGTGITSLPDGLTVGGSLDLSDTGITSLPDGLTVGGSLDLSDTGITGAQYGCGNENRAIFAYMNNSKRVVSLGCKVLTRDEAIKAVSGKYGDSLAGQDYIKKIELAFDFHVKKQI